MKVLSAITYEIDVAEVAVAEVLEQLNIKENLMASSFGFITCYAEFIETGVVAAICAALPFDVLGITTLASATADACDYLALTVTVYTGDDVKFSCAHTGSLSDKQKEPIAEAYQAALARLSEPPVMMMVVAPLINHVGGEKLLEILDEVTGGLPVFGTLAIDNTQDYHLTKTIFNGVASRTSLALVLISGAVKPRFFIKALSEENAQKQKAIITDSTGNVLKAVNDVSFMEYLGTLGMHAGEREVEGLNTIPILVNYNDGTPPAIRAIYLVTEEGHAVCGGSMPLGSTLAIGSITHDDVIDAAEELAADIKAALTQSGASGVMMFPCLSRALVLGPNREGEMRTVMKGLNGALPFVFAYSGGEICPVSGKGGELVNRFHNFTLICCLM